MKQLNFFAALCCMTVAFAACEQQNDNQVITYHEHVDLNLPSGLKWAAYNVGAIIPEDYGDYFAWGETLPKNYYYWNTYKWCNGTQTTLSKYCSDASYGNHGFTDQKTVLDLADDAARANWGGKWRIPTDDEWKELIDNCTWTWTTHNGVNGYEVKGSNGNSIFLPAAGFFGYEVLVESDLKCCYWSSSLHTEYPSRAWLGFDHIYYCRYYGLSVRPVME